MVAHLRGSNLFLILYFKLEVKHMPLVQNQLSEESSSAHCVEVILHVYQ